MDPDFESNGNDNDMLAELRSIGQELGDRRRRDRSRLAASRADGGDSDGSDGDSDGDGPSLGPDVFDVRQHAAQRGRQSAGLSDVRLGAAQRGGLSDVRLGAAQRGGQSAGVGGSDGAAKASAAAVQVDLNRAENIDDSGLEDPNLREHMKAARERFAKSQVRTELDAKELKAKDAAIQRALSKILTSLTDVKRAVRTVEEMTRKHAENVAVILEGSRPHGYSPTASPADLLRELGKKVVTTAAESEAVHEQLCELEKELTLARREYEALSASLVIQG